MSEDKILSQKMKNFGRTAGLFIGMLALMIGLGYSLFGVTGLIWTGMIGFFTLVASTQISTHMIMRMQGAQPVPEHQAPELYDMIRQLSERASLSKTPKLYYIPNGMLNAFATGRKEDPGIALTQGLLSRLNMRELSGVIAHELSHIRNNDLRLKSMVNVILRLTNVFSFTGKLLLFIYLPMLFMGQPPFSWVAILLLLAAPTLMALMVTAFSRTRELEADLEAARLTGDPDGLANALKKLDYYNQGGIMSIFRPRQLDAKIPDFLRSHPTTEERVGRLQDLSPGREPLSMLNLH